MQNLLKTQNSQNKSIVDFNQIKTMSTYDIPLEHKDNYFKALNRLTEYNENFICEGIFDGCSNSLTYPVGISYIENYLSGFRFKYVSCINSDFLMNELNGSIEGMHYYNRENNVVYIFYNKNTSKERQRYTIVHELLHFCQSLDISFQEYLNNLIANQVFNISIINHLLERSTEKAVALYLMPESLFCKVYNRVDDLSEVVSLFKVSYQTAEYRLKECEYCKI